MGFHVDELRLNSGTAEGLAASDGDIRSALLRAELIGEMVVAHDASVSDRDHMVVEISDTAHQISQGSFLISFSLLIALYTLTFSSLHFC